MHSWKIKFVKLLILFSLRPSQFHWELNEETSNLKPLVYDARFLLTILLAKALTKYLGLLLKTATILCSHRKAFALNHDLYKDVDKSLPQLWWELWIFKRNGKGIEELSSIKLQQDPVKILSYQSYTVVPNSTVSEWQCIKIVKNYFQ